MREIARLLNEMRAAGVLDNQAIFGAIARMRYTGSVATLDADVLVSALSPDRIDVLTSIHEYGLGKGYAVETKRLESANGPFH